MADLKIMFWTINNTYAYKVYTLKTDNGSSGDDGKKEAGPQVESLFRSRNRDVRQKISDVIHKINPDIVILVEYSVGQYTLITDEQKGDESADPQKAGDEGSGQDQPDDDAAVKVFDRFGPYIYRKNLNRTSSKAWDAQLTSVDCSDLSEEQHAGTRSFELYCVLWKKSKVKPVRNLAAEVDGKEKSLVFHPRNPASMIFALKDKPQTKFTLVMFHAEHEMQDGQEKVVASTSGTTSDSQKHDSRSSIRAISELKRLNDAVQSARKAPIILAGNFELDEANNNYQPLKDLGFQVRIDGKTEFAKKENDKSKAPSVPVTSEANAAAGQSDAPGTNDGTDKFDLTRACDSILTVNFEEIQPQEGKASTDSAHDINTGTGDKPEQKKAAGIYDFIKEDCNNDVDEALTISNHLPVYATVRLK